MDAKNQQDRAKMVEEAARIWSEYLEKHPK